MDDLLADPPMGAGAVIRGFAGVPLREMWST
jgi:hypothetical protein